MKNSLKHFDFWQKKRNELPINDNPHEDWLQMEALLGQHMPIGGTNGGNWPALIKRIKTLSLTLVSLSAAAMVYVFSSSHFIKNNTWQRNHKGNKHIKSGKYSLSDTDAQSVTDSLPGPDTTNSIFTEVKGGSFSSSYYIISESSLYYRISVNDIPLTNQVDIFQVFRKKNPDYTSTDDIMAENVQAKGRSALPADLDSVKGYGNSNPDNATLLNNDKSSYEANMNNRVANTPGKNASAKEKKEINNHDKGIAGQNTSGKTAATGFTLTKSVPGKNTATAVFRVKNTVSKNVRIKGLRNNNKSTKANLLVLNMSNRARRYNNTRLSVVKKNGKPRPTFHNGKVPVRYFDLHFIMAK